MIKIRDPNLAIVAALDQYTDDQISEQLNGAYTFSFTSYFYEDRREEYLVTGNLADVEGQLFPIVKTTRSRSDGIPEVAVSCEHITYRLNNYVFEEGFVHAGLPADLMNLALSGTGFSLGRCDVPIYISVDIAEENVTVRSILLEIAKQCGGDLVWNNSTVDLLQKRGADRGVDFRVGKNIQGIVKDEDASGGVRIMSYEVDVLELRDMPEYGMFEAFELGDVVRVLDRELGVDELQRIVQYTYSPRLRQNSKVQISSVIPGLDDRVTQIITDTVLKDKIYNGTRIGPENGFEAFRSDLMARAVMNATEGIKLQSGNGSGSWEDVLFFDFSGNANFSGIITASEFNGGSIKIGEGANVLMANYQGFWAGAADMAGAPFSVDMQGRAKLFDMEASGTIIGSEIRGGTVTGAIVRTSEAGRRIQMDQYGLYAYDDFGLVRISISANSNNSVAAIVFRDSVGNSAGEINSYNGEGLTIYSDDRINIGGSSTLVPIEIIGTVGLRNIRDLYQYLMDKVGPP